MGAPRKNKNAVGHGRPPNPGFTDEDLIKLGEELLGWMKECDANPKSEIVHLSEWYSEKKAIPRSQWESIIHRSCFIGYYERASDWIGKRILKNKKLPPAYGSRFLSIYFKDLRKHEKRKAKRLIDYEYKRKLELEKKKIDYSLQRKFEIDSQKSMAPNDKALEELLSHLKTKD